MSPGCGRPHTGHPIAKINEVTDLALILLISVLAYQVITFCQKHLEQSLCDTFTHSQLLTEVFIFSCCNGTFAIYVAATKRQTILRYIDSTFSQLHCLKFYLTNNVATKFPWSKSGRPPGRCMEILQRRVYPTNSQRWPAETVSYRRVEPIRPAYH